MSQDYRVVFKYIKWKEDWCIRHVNCLYEDRLDTITLKYQIEILENNV